MISQEIATKLQSKVRAYLPDAQYRAFIFGSQATGAANKRSDIDLGIEGPAKVDLQILGQIEDAIEESDIPRRVDVVDMNRTSPGFRAIAKRQIVEI